LVTRHCSRSQPERVELDEAFGVALVVDRVGLEGREPLLVERVRRATTDNDDASAVELHARLARHGLLRRVTRSAHQLRLRREPEAIIDALRELQTQRVAQA